MLTTMLHLLQSYTTLLHVSEEAKSSLSQQPDQSISIYREFSTCFDSLIALPTWIGTRLTAIPVLSVSCFLVQKSLQLSPTSPQPVLSLDLYRQLCVLNGRRYQPCPQCPNPRWCSRGHHEKPTRLSCLGRSTRGSGVLHAKRFGAIECQIHACWCSIDGCAAGGHAVKSSGDEKEVQQE